MWQPGFECISAEPVWLHGWHRRFSLRSSLAWGVEDQPGLSLGIFPGGSLLGMSLRVSDVSVKKVLSYLDQREEAYCRERVEVVGLNGSAWHALTYTPDPMNDRWDPDLPLHDQVVMIRQGVGAKGSSRSYLEKTVSFLEKYGVRDGDMHDLLAAVRDRD